MNNEPIVVNEDGFKAIGFSVDFRKYARENEIRDPFEVSRQLFKKRCCAEDMGLIIEDDEPTRAEKDAYIKMRDEYVARKCFYEIGYESFLAHTQPKDYECGYDVSYMRNEIEFIPCKSADHQCRFDCVRFVECALNNARGLD